ncbi:MAG TPA: GntR family transcriptional regulator [Candidatus Saccharimonadales bacterium]|nr:GntR family transcriptional regulator [Candidatus Saccharimonadales bacterium]
MFVHLNPNSGMPIYRQLFQQLRQRIVSGQLAPDEQMPSVRDLSAELKINMLTVAKVYQWLESEGFVETRRGLGTFVLGGRETRSLTRKRKLIADAVEQVVAEAQHLELDAQEVIELIEQRFAETKRRP